MNENSSRLQGPGTTVELSLRKRKGIYKLNVETEQEKGKKYINNTF